MVYQWVHGLTVSMGTWSNTPYPLPLNKGCLTTFKNFTGLPSNIKIVDSRSLIFFTPPSIPYPLIFLRVTLVTATCTGIPSTKLEKLFTSPGRWMPRMSSSQLHLQAPTLKQTTTSSEQMSHYNPFMELASL